MTPDEELQATLAHFGIKGMKWGVSKNTEKTTKRKVARINRQIDRLDTNRAVNGYGMQGYELNKMYKKQISKNPKYAFGKLSTEEKLKVRNKAYNKARNKQILYGVGNTAVALGIGAVLISTIKTNPRHAAGNKAMVGSFGATVGAVHVSAIRDIHAARKLDKLQTRREQLESSK